MLIVIAMLAVDRRTNHVVTQEEQKRFEQVPQTALGCPFGADMKREPSKQKHQDRGHDQLDDHEPRNTETRLGFIEIFGRTEWLRN